METDPRYFKIYLYLPPNKYIFGMKDSMESQRAVTVSLAKLLHPLGNRVGAGAGNCLLSNARWNHLGPLRNCRFLGSFSKQAYLSLLGCVCVCVHESLSHEFNVHPELKATGV